MFAPTGATGARPISRFSNRDDDDGDIEEARRGGTSRLWTVAEVRRLFNKLVCAALPKRAGFFFPAWLVLPRGTFYPLKWHFHIFWLMRASERLNFLLCSSKSDLWSGCRLIHGLDRIQSLLACDTETVLDELCLNACLFSSFLKRMGIFHSIKVKY